MLKRILDTVFEYLRITAIKRVLASSQARRTEIIALAILSIVFAALEGLGLSLLLPILQYAESGKTALEESSGVFWSVIASVIRFLGLPVNLLVLLLLAFVPILLRQAVFYLNAWLSASVGTRVASRKRMEAVDAILQADIEFFERHPLGHLVGAVTTQAETASEAVLAVMRTLLVVLLISLYLAIMVAISAPLTATTLAFAVLVSMVVRRCIVAIRRFSDHAISVSQTMTSRVLERFSLARLIKMRHSEALERDLIERLSLEMRAIRIRQARLGASIEILADPLLMLSAFVTLYVGITLLHMTLAQLGLMLFLMTRLNAKVKEFNDGRQQISLKMAGLQLLNEVAAEARASRVIVSGRRPFEGIRRNLVFDSVSFSFPSRAPADRDRTPSNVVLADISFEIPAGSLVAIVGRSGQGKSTILELIPRLREPSSGSILIDGVDIREFDLGSLRRSIGYLTQDPMLFNDTVRNNLTYALDKEPSDQQLAEALQAAHAEFVYDLPDGLDTVLQDRGARLSGGERQRLALARVLLADPRLLLLDEPTSALDSESESAIQHALSTIRGKKTIVTVAHRLATVVDADRIFVVENGRIVQQGTHPQLAEAEGPYKKLFRNQMTLGSDVL
ncbi:MAG: ABC transporter ATP-binding protein [Coriobacteriia bacterium]|jgi:ABC-type multidrug transport system fused ATPase/permease subunit|nr:ABC transporter ATP-binding protein [Coriobacteriia bacterium]